MRQILKAAIQRIENDHFITNLSDWHLKQITDEIKLRAEKPQLPPFSDIEKFHEDRPWLVTKLYVLLIKENIEKLKDWIITLDTEEIRILMGQRITDGSIISENYFPPNLEELLEVAEEDYNEKLSIVARSWTKHAFQCDEDYWQKPKGSPEELNRESIDMLLELIQDFTWWNTFEHYQHGPIYEIRDPTGHGARWSFDPLEFIGFIEPFDENTKTTVSKTKVQK